MSNYKLKVVKCKMKHSCRRSGTKEDETFM